MNHLTGVAWRFLGLMLFAGLVFSGSARAQMKFAADMKDYNQVFGLGQKGGFKGLKVTLIAVSSPACIFYPGEQPKITVQIENLTAQAVKITGRADFLRFATVGIPDDIWLPQVVKFEDLPALPVALELPAKGFVNLTLEPALPEVKGGYGLVLDLGDYGRDFIAGLARVFRPDPRRIQYPSQSLDSMDPDVLARLGIQAIRMEFPYVHTKHAEYAKTMARLEGELAKLWERKVTVALQIGAGLQDAPLVDKDGKSFGAPRTFLDEAGVMKGGKGDLCWMPQDDPDFEEYLYTILCKYGWPKGPLTAVLLWNEPWEGVSISGWGADMLRYRAIYKRMAIAVQRAEKDAGVDVLVGGGDSSSNAWDKLFPDGTNELLPVYDFCSIHYQGMSAPVLHKDWNERKSRKGRVLIWDTESWVANTDDRIAGVVATNRAAGYDRALGVFFGNICTQLSHGRTTTDTIRAADGKPQRNVRPLHAWPAAASVSAVQHFIGERPFKEILFKDSLPWVYVFGGENGNEDDGTVVVVGDIGPLFNARQMLYRGVRSLAQTKKQSAILRELDALPADAPKRAELEKEYAADTSFTGVTMTLTGVNSACSLYDFYGNRVANAEGKIAIPLDARGFYLRADPAAKGSFAMLLEALRTARVDGLEPLDIIVHDPLQPLDRGGQIEVELNNMLNRLVVAKLALKLEGCELEYPAVQEFAPKERKRVKVRAKTAQVRPDNSYRLTVQADAGADGLAVHRETVHVNLIAQRTIAVDGKLDDWAGAYPQTVQGTEKATRTLTEAAWLPFVAFEAGEGGALATGFLAYDAQNFYFAMKTPDSTPAPGTLRFSTRDDDAFFYPETVKVAPKKKDGSAGEVREYAWRPGVPRYSYRRNPVLPDGAASKFDNVQIAFNVLAPGEDGWLPNLPGRMPGFISYQCTDYEYALNAVAPEHGGGFEVWRLLAPGMSRKHFYPRQPKHPLEGAVEQAKLVTRYENGTRFTEAALPWSELPEVKKRLDAGQTVKFSFRVNSNSGGPHLELAKERSVSRVNNYAFHPDWVEHWANEVEFAFEK